ncbi:MAG TPA: efflux RND transporter permease subunit, partial [Coriobacteriia bacterium]
SKESGGGLSAVAIRRPVFTSMIMIGLVVLGLFSFRRLPIDQFPNIDFPFVVVQTVYQGASPETIEQEVTRRLEESFNTVEGVKQITSMSLEGVSQVLVEFQLNRDGDQAAQDVRAKIDQIRRDLPTDIDPPMVMKFDPGSQPILSLSISSPTVPAVELTRLADEDIRRKLESVSGVGQVQLAGGLAREIRINIIPSKMQALGVSAADIMGALQKQNLEVPAGFVQRNANEDLVRVLGRIKDPAEFNDVVLVNRGGLPVRLGQVARVEDATEDERSLAYVDGNRAIAMDVLKISGANTVAVADGVKKALTELQTRLPKGTEVRIVRDNSKWIRSMVDDVLKELLIGALLTVLVVMLFLNDWKATAITSLALPISIISAFILMGTLSFSLNMLTLMALSLSIGILIDDAIVVIENIVRHRELGQDHFTAAKWGTREIFLAVMATTLTIVAVFIPVAFMGGIVGRFFYQFGLTVAFAVLVSLFVSFTLTPMLAARWGVEPHPEVHGLLATVTRPITVFNRWFDHEADRYRGIIEWALANRKKTLGIALLAFVSTMALFPLIGGEFFPKSDSAEFGVNFHTPEGSSIEYTRQKALEMDRVLHSIPGVDYTYLTVGAGLTGTVTHGNFYVKLVPTADRKKTEDELQVEARQRLASIYGVTSSIVASGGMGGAHASLQINIKGPNVSELQKLSDDLSARMKAIPGIMDVESSLGQPRPEYRIAVNRNMANDLGLDIGQVAATVRPLIAGQTVSNWQDPSGEERDVVLQVAPEERRSVEDLRTLPLATSRKNAAGVADVVPLQQIAEVQKGTAPTELDRQDLERVVTVSANSAPGFSTSKASAAILQSANQMRMPPGYSVKFGGETEMMNETVGYVLEAILLAVILIYLILASQFESLTQPFAIMLSLPLSLIGVLIALLLTHSTFSMMSMIGVILLMGLVTKNAILLVDNANERRTAGKDRWTALVEAGRVRLRPIMMTTAAMIFGMLPIALGLGEGGGLRAPMARAVIGGLITSTMLTLIVVPVAYTYLDDFGAWTKKRFVSEEKQRAIKEEEKASGLGLEPTWGLAPVVEEEYEEEAQVPVG